MCRTRHVAVVLAGVLALPGCGRLDRLPTVATTPPLAVEALADASRLASALQAHGAGDLYPLAPGNRWRYVGEYSKQYIPYNGEPIERHWDSKSEVVQVRMEVRHGRTYMREEIGIPDTVVLGGGVRWRRQDRTGLYEYGPTPALDAPPFSETRLLAYPLHVGASWAMFESAIHRVTATVVGHDVLDFPAGRFTAWRIRISNGGQERIVWYGRAGYLGMQEHLESAKPDSAGTFRIIYDHVESLAGLRLVRPSR